MYKAIATPFADCLKPVGSLGELSGGRLGRSAAALAELQVKVEREARQKGYAEGFAQGQLAGSAQAYAEAAQVEKERLSEFTDGLQAAISSIEFAVAEWLRSSEGELAELSVLIATRILGEELSLNPDRIVSLVRECLKEVTHAKEAKVRLNPFDAPAVREREKELLMAVASLDKLEIVSDTHILSGCVIETEGGIIRGTVEDQLQMALNAIREAA